ncbi:MAG: helix-hairpin-helix domain-containing protein [Oscillospiraceae bacterium]|nr:helix-hairpin-helix domain-containing protein [Oscillospiraceae bacterium]
MKKPRVSLLVIITCIFAAFLAGFFAGRNVNRTPVRISAVASAPAAEETAAASAAPTEAPIVDINTATPEQLQALPGIGEVLARRIIDYRTEYGPFRSAGDLLAVSGIGEKKLEAILDLITVGG